jgi:hypothetical protein
MDAVEIGARITIIVLHFLRHRFKGLVRSRGFLIERA